MNYFLYFILFAFGLAIGSFLNVISLRYRPGQKLLDLKIIGGRSHCRNCLKKLAWYELLPLLSFIIQKGKCRNCKAKLSWQYPIVEFLSGIFFAAVPLKLTYHLSLIAYNSPDYWLWLIAATWILIFILFILLSIIDYYYSIIPNQLNLLLGILGIILTGLIYFSGYQLSINNSFLGHYALIFGLQNNLWLNHIFAGIAAMIFIASVIILSRGRGMGWGDFKLVGALGLIFGWPDTVMILFLAFIIGSLFVLPMLIKKQKTMKDAVPFGPFLISGAVLVFFFGFQIIDGYFKLFNIYY